MVSTSVIVAFIFAAILGATLIWLALFCVHRYIHLSCLELDRWFDLIASRQPEANTCYYDRDIGWDGHTKLRSRSSKRERGGGRSEHAKFRKRYPAQDIESLQSKDAEAKWLGQRGGKKAKLILPTSVPVQGQWQEQQIYPSLGWQGYALGCGEVVNPQPILYPKTTVEGAAPLPPSLAIPAVILQQQTFPQMAMAMPEPAHQRSRYHEPYAETCSDTSKDNRPMKPAAKSEHRFPRERRVNEVDYIHICDEYPSIVKEGLKKSASATLSSSSCSTDASGSTLEMPRATIPQATRRFADTVPFQLPDYPHLVSRARYAPTSYPRQWMGRGTGGRAANAGVRYAPFTGMSRQVDLHANSRRQAPSIDASRSRIFGRRGQQTWSPRCTDFNVDWYSESIDEVRAKKIEVLGSQHKAREQDVYRNLADTNVNNDDKDRLRTEEKPSKRQSPKSQQIPRFNPMPVPIVEEPLTPGSGTPPSITGLSSRLDGNFYSQVPVAPVSPLVAVQRPVMSTWSSVSSLHGGKAASGGRECG